jgi:hypothetical protein
MKKDSSVILVVSMAGFTTTPNVLSILISLTMRLLPSEMVKDLVKRITMADPEGGWNTTTTE